MSLERGPERGPEDPGAPVTAYNWQDPPFNRWAFWHVGDVLPTYPVARGDGPARALPASGAALDLFALADLLTRPTDHPYFGRAVTAVRARLADAARPRPGTAP